MEIERLQQYLDHPAAATEWLKSCHLTDIRRGQANLVSMAVRGVTLDLLAAICDQLAAVLPTLSDPDMALNNLDRFVEAARNPLSLAALFQRDDEALPTLLQIFSTSQYLSDHLIRDKESYDLLRMTEGASLARQELIGDLLREVQHLSDDKSIMTALRRFKHRETLRIAYGDIVRGLPLETVTRQISYVADAVVEAALFAARRKVAATRGTPLGLAGRPASAVVLALGKLGGEELNYSSDIDLILCYDQEGKTEGARSQSNQEFFERVGHEMIRLLSEATDLGSAYRVDMRLRPAGSQGRIATSLPAMLRYYDVYGRTWERQAYVKARAIAGDLALGAELLARLSPWIYRRYLSLADITGIKALKRRIEQQTRAAGDDALNVKTGHGGIRDIEFVIQFLQLLNGGSLPEIRTGNTLAAIVALEQAGCLTFQERSLLEENYRFLRKLEHRLQIMFDLQTHLLPEAPDELRKLAIRMGFAKTAERSALEAFQADLTAKTEVNRKILDHLLHDAFGDDAQNEPEVDLINDPDPPTERIQEVLGRYPFRNVSAAYANLMALATEKIRFLSTRRCRHFLAAIAPRLVAAIAATPDPDLTLVNLSQVSDSLGGKGVLWELFSFNPPSLQLYVRLCATCPYLAGILTSNPGMIDELMDSLRLEGLPTLEQLQKTLADLCRGAEDLDPILHSFKDAQHLRVGVRDILGKDDITATHQALSDIAETCLRQIASAEYARLTEKYGQPTIAEGELAGQTSELVILALGKLGGREPNYHSDLDIIFLYDHEGSTVHARRGGRTTTTSNQHFFSELSQKIIKLTSHLGPFGRLYEVDPRLRPSGRSGTLVMPVAEFRRYFASGEGQLWERQALCNARAIHGSPRATPLALAAVAEAAFGPAWQPEHAAEIRQMRMRLQATASPRNLKRGFGGTVDIEFIAQMLQLRYGGKHPALRVPGTLAALSALHAAGFLSPDDCEYFSQSYRYLRSVESRIRLMNSAGRHELPTDEMELRKLAYLLNVSDVATLLAQTEAYTRQNRQRFERLFESALVGSA
jgi:glutamate-ammonia-ligase adenylyltransferase